MIWYICLLITILLMLCSALVLFDRSRGRLRSVIAVLLMALATFIVYIPVFFQKYDFATAVFRSIINILQVISLDADYTEFYERITEQITAVGTAKLYMSIMGMLHFLLPALSLFAVYKILIHYYANLRIFFINHRNRPLYIFSACNEDSLYLAESIKKNVKKCDLLFADDRDQDQYTDRIDSIQAVLFQGNVRDMNISHKKEKDIYYFCIDEDDRDLNMALYLIRQYENEDKAVQKRIHISVLTEQKDVDLMLDSTNKGLIDIQVVNTAERIAYRLVEKYPLYDYADESGSTVLLVGMGEVNCELLRTLCWCGQMGPFIPQKILVAGIGIEPIIERMQYYYPDLFTVAFHLQIFTCSSEKELYETIQQKCMDATYVSVDAEGDRKTLETAIELRRILYRKDSLFQNAPPIFAYIRSDEMKEMVTMLRTPDARDSRRISYHIIPHGDYKETFSYEAMIQEPLGRLAKNVHMVYTAITEEQQGGSLDVEKALERYNALEVDKRSNRANALHIRYKLAILGLDYTDREDAQEVDLADYLTEDKLEILTRAEHDRWMAFLQSEGWTRATLDEVSAYQKSGLSAGQKSTMMKMHPDICSFDELVTIANELHLIDLRLYDSGLITRIPEILHDRWNVSGMKFKIIKREQKNV